MIVFFSTCVGFSFLFSLLLLIHNIHLLAVIGSAVAVLYSAALLYAGFSFIRNKNCRTAVVMRKLFEYWTFVLIACFICSRAFTESTPYTFDAILALLWFFIVILKYTILYYLKEKHLVRFFPHVDMSSAAGGKKKTILSETLEWIDAAFYAIFFVLLVNIFAFQVYRIPSESMVPEFMIGDTVVGFKTAAGPAFPLSSFRLPQWKQYKRGDIVILNNPNYADTPQARLKTFLSQLVYMMSLAQVNLNTDEYGKPKADPLVKRITGLPGEKLMMVDGVLYVKRQEDESFTPIEEENRYAHWNLELLPQSELRLVHDIKIGTRELHIMEKIEAARQNLSFAAAAQEAESLVNRLLLLKPEKDTAVYNQFLEHSEYELIALFSANDSIGRKIVTTNGGASWFKDFMTGWIPAWSQEAGVSRNLYEKRFAQLNALMKICFGKLIIRNIELFQANVSADVFMTDPVRTALLQEAQEYAFYAAWTNQRNMPVFPEAENEYIPDDAYFMMGDNRFNSTDLRHAYFFRLAPVDRYDSMPVLFQSNAEPKYVFSSKILGTTLLRVYPFSRFGVL